MAEPIPEEARDMLAKDLRALCQSWYAAGQANNGVSFDPFAGEFVKQAREATTAFSAKLAEALP
jgi:hypothetical protein